MPQCTDSSEAEHVFMIERQTDETHTQTHESFQNLVLHIQSTQQVSLISWYPSCTDKHTYDLTRIQDLNLTGLDSLVLQ
mgnify:CR=1 FL=1